MMLDAEEITVILREIRTSLGLERGTLPVVEEVYTHRDGSLHIVVPDRAEKSMCLGPGGRVAAEFAKRTGRHATFYGADEIKIRKHRCELTLRRIDEITPQLDDEQTRFVEALKEQVIYSAEFPRREPVKGKSVIKQVAVAFSGGTDSSASAILLKNMGVTPVLYTVNIGNDFLSETDLTTIQTIAQKLELHHQFIDPLPQHREIVERSIHGTQHPCGPCHKNMYAALKNYLEAIGSEILVTGELLPTGRQALVLHNKLLVVHLPAALAISKFRTTRECEIAGVTPITGHYGCRLLAATLKPKWSSLGPSVFRVLRELEAGILTTGQASKQIKNIVRPRLQPD